MKCLSCAFPTAGGPRLPFVAGGISCARCSGYNQGILERGTKKNYCGIYLQKRPVLVHRGAEDSSSEVVPGCSGSGLVKEWGVCEGVAS